MLVTCTALRYGGEGEWDFTYRNYTCEKIQAKLALEQTLSKVDWLQRGDCLLELREAAECKKSADLKMDSWMDNNLQTIYNWLLQYRSAIETTS